MSLDLDVDLKHRYFTLDKHNELELDKKNYDVSWRW